MSKGIVLLASSAALAGALCQRTPPPVDFHSDAGSPTITARDASPDVEPAPPQDAATGRPARVASVLVGGDGASLTQDGVTLRAGRGERLLRYLALDLDNDHDNDLVVALSRGNEPAPLARVYRREPGGFVEAAVPELQSAPAPSCTSLDLHANGQRSVVASWTCPNAAPPANPSGAGPALGAYAAAQAASSPVAVHFVVALSPSASVRLRVDELGPSLAGVPAELAVDAFDKDNDGLDDAVVDVTTRRTSDRPTAGAHAQLVYFDRPAGMARDTTEPEHSFAQLASVARGRGRRRAAEAVADLERAVRLRRLLCSEPGLSRVRINGAAGVACAGSAGLRGVLEAGARALLSLGELPATSALLRPEVAMELLGVTVSDRVQTELRRGFGPEVPAQGRQGGNLGAALDAANVTRATTFQLDPPASPLRALLRGPVGGSVDLTSLALTPGEAGSTLDLQPVAPDGSLALQGYYQTCSGLVAALCPATAAECRGFTPRANALPSGARMVPVQELPAPDLALRCLGDAQTSDPVSRAADLRTVGWGREGLVVHWRGLLYRLAPGAAQFAPLAQGAPLGGPFPAGSSASASGDRAVVPGSEGLFVRSAGRWQLWTAPELQGRARSLTDLTVSDDGHLLVGLLGTSVWVLRQSAPDAAVASPIEFHPLPPPVAAPDANP